MPPKPSIRGLLWCLEELGVEYTVAVRGGTPSVAVNGKPIGPAPAIPALLQALPPPAPKGIESPPADSSTYWAGFAEGLAAAIAHSPGDIPAALEEVELFMHESDGGKGRNFTGVMAEIGAGDFAMSTPLATLQADEKKYDLTHTGKWLARMRARPAWKRAEAREKEAGAQ